MFFLGGFNTIIPYLVYLSLIWVFLIIGIRGKIAETWHVLASKATHEEIIQVSNPGCNNILLIQKNTHYHQNKTVKNIQINVGYFPAAICINMHIPENVKPVITTCLNAFSFRGPPVIAA